MIGSLAAWPLTDRLRGATAWWVAELRGLVPRRMRERRRLADAEIRFEAGRWHLWDRTGSDSILALDDLGSLGDTFARIKGRRRQARVILVVPLARCFTRTSEIPRRMIGRASTILASELEITTPFSPGTAHWDWFADEGQDPATLLARQVVLKRRDTEALFAILGAHGVAVTAIAVEAADGRRLPLNLVRHDGPSADDAADLSRARRVLAGAAALAGLAIVPVAFSQQSTTLNDLDAAIADATDAVALRPGLPRAALQQLGEALTAKRDWPATAVLNGLAASLPSDSHLDHIFLEKDIATIQGRTASVHNLERSLAAARLFTPGHNTAPAGDGQDGLPFTLRLKVRPVPRSPEA